MVTVAAFHNICSISSSSSCPKRKFPPTNIHTFDLNFYLLSQLSIPSPLFCPPLIKLTICNWPSKKRVFFASDAPQTILHPWCSPSLWNDQIPSLTKPVLISSLSTNCFGNKSFSQFSNKLWCCCALPTISDFIFWWLLETICVETILRETMVGRDGRHNALASSKFISLSKSRSCQWSHNINISSSIP